MKQLKAVLLILLSVSCASEDNSSPNSITGSTTNSVINSSNNIKHNTEQVNQHTIFPTLHQHSENLYHGLGTWGEQTYGYKMALRDSSWRGYVYSELALSLPNENYGQRAQEVAQYLMSIQSDNGVFGFPADENNPEFASKVALVNQQCPSCIEQGWVIDLPEGDIGELYYDHGYALTFLAKEYLRNSEPKPEPSYLTSINKAAEWALNKPVHHNLNYNSALSKGLSWAFKATLDQRFLDKALTLHQQGIFPFLLATGHASDSHNQQLEYHAFITSGLIALLAILPIEHEEYQALSQQVESGVAYLQQQTWLADQHYGQTWPGTALFVWHELQTIRALSNQEIAARDHTIGLINNYLSEIESAEDYEYRKALYSYFSVGLFFHE